MAPMGTARSGRPRRFARTEEINDQLTLVTWHRHVTVGTRDADGGEFSWRSAARAQARWGEMPTVEFETGKLTIAVMQSDAFGVDFPSQQPPDRAAHRRLNTPRTPRAPRLFTRCRVQGVADRLREPAEPGSGARIPVQSRRRTFTRWLWRLRLGPSCPMDRRPASIPLSRGSSPVISPD